MTRAEQEGAATVAGAVGDRQQISRRERPDLHAATVGPVPTAVDGATVHSTRKVG